MSLGDAAGGGTERDGTDGVLAAGIVLCGGLSTRMGEQKALLPFGPEVMLQRVVRLLSDVVAPVVVVAAAGQSLPALGKDVLVVRDERPDAGPLEGLRAGLNALVGRAEAAFASGCDVPLLSSAFVRHMIQLRGNFDIAAPWVQGFHHPLAAVYSVAVLPAIEALLAEGRRGPKDLFDRVSTRLVMEDELRAVDPALQSLRNVNRREDYLAALAEAGFSEHTG